MLHINEFFNRLKFGESGGIGRRTGLRNQRLVHGGSSPPSRTIFRLNV